MLDTRGHGSCASTARSWRSVGDRVGGEPTEDGTLQQPQSNIGLVRAEQQFFASDPAKYLI